jgi:hypothetical protein
MTYFWHLQQDFSTNLKDIIIYIYLRIVVSNKLFVLFVYVLCTQCFQFLCVCLRLMYPMLPVSLCLSSSYVPNVASVSVFVFVLCTQCCQCLCVCLRLMYPMLPVSLCFSLSYVPNVASFSGLSFFDCSFGIFWRLFPKMLYGVHHDWINRYEISVIKDHRYVHWS